MRRFRFTLFAFLLISTSVFSSVQKKTVCLNMIVKNESTVIRRSLASVKPLIDYWVIVDTGSTDGTQEIIREFMKDIPGELYESPWFNFEYNRNEALHYAKGKTDYILFIDADEEFVYDEDFVLPDLDKDLYSITTSNHGKRYQRSLLINGDLDWKWVGVIHEYLDCPQVRSREILPGVTNIYRSEGCRSQDPDKFHKDAKILEEALEKDPNNSRYVFYLAQSYRDAGVYEKAIENYQKRVEMGGWDQEVFWAKYQIARLKEWLNAPEKEVIKSYTEAFCYRPSRAEPLYHLSRYFRTKEEFFLGYLAAGRGLEVPLSNDILFVYRWIYDYSLLIERAVCAYWIGQYEECCTLSESVLQMPNLPENVKECAESNLKWAQSKLASNN
ncbi:MAG: SPBc2 prophage-derived glycosyltransferase SunS [Chlamydiae bacterium]|nr:SPBc2 prophage-derived glycosyltransferase SunS [Chlamydiota bacterium]